MKHLAVLFMFLTLQVCVLRTASADFSTGVAAYKRGDFKIAFKVFKKSAQQGDASAQFNLGLMYDKGQGVAQDYAQAVEWYRKAAQQGYVEAQFELGWMYQMGEGVTQNNTQAAEWYRKAALQGNAEAQYNLGVLQGENLTPSEEDWEDDLSKTQKEYREMVEKAYAPTRYFGPSLEEQLETTEEEAVKKIREEALQGYADAQNYLGVMYYEGDCVPEDDAKAVKWFRKAAQQGLVFAQCSLALMYEEGRGVAQDYVRSHMWWNIAISHGVARVKDYRDVVAEEGLKFRIFLGRRPSSKFEARARKRAKTWMKEVTEGERHDFRIYKGRAEQYRDGVAKEMTPSQVAEAQRLAREWKPKKE